MGCARFCTVQKMVNAKEMTIFYFVWIKQIISILDVDFGVKIVDCTSPIGVAFALLLNYLTHGGK